MNVWLGLGSRRGPECRLDKKRVYWLEGERWPKALNLGSGRCTCSCSCLLPMDMDDIISHLGFGGECSGSCL